jgi:hypothetical protein
MKTIESERLAKVILESSKIREAAPQTQAAQSSIAKANEQKLLQVRRQFDKKYSISTPRELMKI